MAWIKVVERGVPDKYKDNEAYQDLIDYCCEFSKAIYCGAFNVQSIYTASQEMLDVTQESRKAFGKRISHTIISFSDDDIRRIPDIERVAYQCAQYYASKYQVVYSVHAYPQKHIHIVFNRVSFADRRKYPDRYGDRWGFWCHVRNVLSVYGVRLWK